jgi:hypothetical protein
VFRDEAIETVLTRYQRCRDTSVHPQLRDYVIRKDVWRNPKLRSAGIATAWNRVGEDVWMMVLRWINEGNLKDFFEILAARNNADEGRLEFWSRYMDQITWTRLIFSSETLALARRNPDVRQLIAREEGAYATVWGANDVDAFMMLIGDRVIVEFSKTPNAAYVYHTNRLKFDRYATHYFGNTSDLKYGFQSKEGLRIVHTPGWEDDAERRLRRLGIRPD